LRAQKSVQIAAAVGCQFSPASIEKGFPGIARQGINGVAIQCNQIFCGMSCFIHIQLPYYSKI
jgi:hypothetical protein